MNKKKIIIGEIYISEEQEKVSLSADIMVDNEKKILSYTVDKKWKQYLVTERSDSFVVALLYFSMIKDMDIEWTIPCSERLIYQLKTYFIPIYSNEIQAMHNIDLIGVTTCEDLPSLGGVATGISNGVDSSYTIKKYIKGNLRYDNYALTHVIFTDWFTADFSDDYKKDFYDAYLPLLPNCAEELNLEYIYIHFPVDEVFSVGRVNDDNIGVIIDEGMFTLKYCSMSLALNKLINIYYFSSGVAPSDFTFCEADMAYHDIFTLPLISTNNMSFYSSGMEVSRIEKVEDIADWKYAQKYLQVCQWKNDTNCGKCAKCIRTMSELNSINKLELFSDRFPVDDYKKNYSKRMAKVLMAAKKGHIFEINILEKMKKNGKKVPIKSYILLPYYNLIEYIRIKLRYVKWARKIYRKFNLDKFLYGTSTKYYGQRSDREILGNEITDK